MILYRITPKAYAHDLSGTGAMLYGGRWNKKGTRMVYTSGSLSLAALEIIANLSLDKLDRSLFCSEVEFPDHLEISELKKLPKDWNQFPYTSGTVSSGDIFLKKNGLCLKVPSAIIPSEFNYLLNPNHDQFSKIKLIDTRPLILDKRIIQKLNE